VSYLGQSLQSTYPRQVVLSPLIVTEQQPLNLVEPIGYCPLEEVVHVGDHVLPSFTVGGDVMMMIVRGGLPALFVILMRRRMMLLMTRVLRSVIPRQRLHLGISMTAWA
jgi:hypothetical protein